MSIRKTDIINAIRESRRNTKEFIHSVPVGNWKVWCQKLYGSGGRPIGRFSWVWIYYCRDKNGKLLGGVTHQETLADIILKKEKEIQ